MKKIEEKDWLSAEIEFYDFIWSEGTELCGTHVNEELMQDFAEGGSLFETMKAKILEKFPTREEALRHFSSHPSEGE